MQITSEELDKFVETYNVLRGMRSPKTHPSYIVLHGRLRASFEAIGITIKEQDNE